MQLASECSHAAGDGPVKIRAKANNTFYPAAVLIF